MKFQTLHAKGLYTFPNPLASVPEGALLVASDVVINEVDTITKRLGFGSYGTTLSIPFKKMYSYKNTLMGWDGTNFWYDSNGTGTWVQITGAFTQPSGTFRIQSAQSNNNLYLATATGVMSQDAPSSIPTLAGVPYPLDATYTLASGSWFANQNTVAYQGFIGFTDANNNLQSSAPSETVIVTNNTGTAQQVTLQWTIPTGLSTNYFYRIYRTRQTAFVASVAQDPGSEVYEVVQKQLTSTDITNQYVTYTDLTPDNLLGAVADTNPTQNTIASANYRPPLCSGGITFYKNSLLFANITTQQIAKITLIAVGSGGFTTGNTITIGGVIYTGDTSTTISTGHFKIFTTGTAAENINNTARELVHVINLYSANTKYWGINASGFSGTPGQISLVERLINTGSFAITSNNGTNFNPNIPSSGTTYSSSNEVSPHKVAVSKSQQPWAVPLTYTIPIGTVDKPILGIAAIRDSVFVFKQEGGIWRIQGTDISNFVVTQFDNTVNILAPDSIATLANQVWFYSNQGVVAVNDNGPVIMSRQIEGDLRVISSSLYPNFASATYAVGYETDRQYILFTVANTTDTIATNCWVFNYMADVRAWTNWALTNTAAIINPVDDTLYLSNFQNGSFVGKQRRTQTIFDYSDFSYAVNITSFSGTTVNLTSTSNVVQGMTIYQEDNTGLFIGQAIVASVVSSTQITTDKAVSWQAGAATVYSAINSFFTYTDIAPYPDVVKHWKDVELFFRDTSFTNLTFSVHSDVDPVDSSVTLTGQEGLGWGEVPWGQEEWGGESGITNVERTFIPRDHARSHWLNPSVQNNEALSNFALTGINIYYDLTSSRMR